MGYCFAWRDCKRIKTGGKDVQDAVESGKCPFYIRSDEVKRIDLFSFGGKAILIPGEGRLGEIFHYINGRFCKRLRTKQDYVKKQADICTVRWRAVPQCQAET